MGIFDKIKEMKNTQNAYVNGLAGNITLNDNNIDIRKGGKQYNIKYTDILHIEKKPRMVIIKTMVDKFKIVPMHGRGLSSNDLYDELISKRND